MSGSQLIFYALSAAILGTALLSVLTRQIFRAAIWLLFTLLGIAGLYFWMEVHFIAAVQIIVYVGGIVVLIIFSIFLTQQSDKDMPGPALSRRMLSALAAASGLALGFLVISRYVFPPGQTAFDASPERIGERMLDTGRGGFALPFEAVSLLLLAAMIGCIVIAMKPKPVTA
jgi:NADH-quinone oxidoreductase subunit J